MIDYKLQTTNNEITNNDLMTNWIKSHNLLMGKKQIIKDEDVPIIKSIDIIKLQEKCFKNMHILNNTMSEINDLIKKKDENTEIRLIEESSKSKFISFVNFSFINLKLIIFL
jgi:hypothetical protein